MNSVPIITKAVSSNPAHSKALLVKHYVILFITDLLQVGGILMVTSVSSTNETGRHDIASFNSNKNEQVKSIGFVLTIDANNDREYICFLFVSSEIKHSCFEGAWSNDVTSD